MAVIAAKLAVVMAGVGVEASAVAVSVTLVNVWMQSPGRLIPVPGSVPNPVPSVHTVSVNLVGYSAVYWKSSRCQGLVPLRHQSRTWIGLPSVGKPDTVVERLVPKERLSWRFRAPWLVPT